MSAPAIAASRRRSCSRPSRSSTCPARTSASACTSPPMPTAANCACGRISPSRCRCDYLASPAAGLAAGLLLSRPGVPRSRRAAGGDSCRPASNSFGRPDKAAADAEMLALGLDATAHYGIAEPEIRMGDVGLFSALVAALDLAPAWKRRLVKDFNRKTSLAHDLDVLTLSSAAEQAGVPGCAGGARRLRSEGRACAGHRPAVDRRHHRGRRPLGRRDRRPLPRAGGARRRDHAAARDARADRTISRHRRRSRRGRGRAARARRRRRASASTPALDLFESRTGFLAARGIDVGRIRFSTAFGRGLDYYTGFVFELHDPAGAPNGPLVAGGRYDELLTRLGAKAPIPAVGFAVWIERVARRRRRAHERAAGHRRAGQGPAAGERRGVLRAAPACSWSSRAARATIAARSPAWPASRSPISRPPKSPRSWRRARCISASPARIWCAR